MFGPDKEAVNDKVAKLRRLVAEAQYETMVYERQRRSSDARLFANRSRSSRRSRVGAVTCFYLPAHSQTLAENLQTIGMVSDFYAGLIVGWQLQGIKFALGATIATSRARLAEFGGLQAIENQPGDDLLIGRLIAEHGHEVKLLPYTVIKLGGCHSFKELLAKRMRWMVVMKHMRRSAHFGLLFTQGLPWLLAAIVVHPSAGLALAIRWYLSRDCDRDRLEHRYSGAEADGLVESYCLDPFVGCTCVLHLVDQLSTPEHSVAGR